MRAYLRPFLFGLLSIFCALPAIAQDLSHTLAAEIQRLKTVAASQPKDDADWKDTEPMVSDRLSRAEEATNSGRLYFALQSLGEAQVLLQSFQSMHENAAAKTIPEFQAHWSQAKLTLTREDTLAKARPWSGTPAAIRALAEAAQGQTIIVLNASKAYAEVTDPSAGFYYLGEARGDADFATFAHELKTPRVSAPRQLRSIAPELDLLQRQTDQLFQPPRSIEKHKQFIRLNSTIKLAKDLDAANLHFGALYEYLFSVQQLALIDGTQSSSTADLNNAIAKAKTQIASSKKDDSIAELFLQKADAFLDPSTHSLGSADQKTQNAAAILDRVLPAYFAFVNGPAPKPERQNSVVTVTLVRWPYT